MLLTNDQVNEIVKKMESVNLSNKDEAILFLSKLWDELPEPKHKQPEQISNWIIDCIFNVYIDSGDFKNAKKWAVKALDNDTAEKGTYEYFQMGRVCYELNEFEESMKYFDIAYQRGKKRAFQEFDKKYWEFYSKNKK